jgi:hypothetical protein
MVGAMADNHPADPSGNTEAFRAFSSTPEEQAPRSAVPLLAAAAVVVLLLAVLFVWLATG